MGISMLDAPTELSAAATSGLMALTGRADGPPLSVPGVVSGLDRLARLVADRSAEVGPSVEVDWTDIVTARASRLALRRRGRLSANGTCRLLRGPDGWMALNLARPEDEAAVAAIVEGRVGADPWAAIGQALAHSSVADMVARARLVGVGAAALGPVSPAAAPWSVHPLWTPAGRRAVSDLRIVDLSSMWAGPLAALLLSMAGGRVVKIESTSRPDGARARPEFYRSLHPDTQPVVALDFSTPSGRHRLRALLDQADVVIESSRPRALEQLGAGPADVEARRGRVWLSITGYGRHAPGRDWVAFGDDAAVAGGLVAWEDRESPVFCGDALADPVTGMMAAAAVFEALAAGGGGVVDVSMQACAAWLAPAPPVVSTPAEGEGEAGGWYVTVEGRRVPVRDRAVEAQPAR